VDYSSQDRLVDFLLEQTLSVLAPVLGRDLGISDIQ